MVNLNLPSQLTEEEQLLNEKYEKLRHMKETLQILNAPKQEPPSSKPRKCPLEAKPDAKEVAKKLLKSGAISAIKIKNKEHQGFKRPKASERKRSICKRQRTPVADFKLIDSATLDDDIPSVGFSSNSTLFTDTSLCRPVKKLYESFVSPRLLADEIKAIHTTENQCKEQEMDNETEKFPQGYTVFVKGGYNLSRSLLQKTFEPIGNIMKIYKANDKNYGFVTFEKNDQAQRAIEEINGTISNGVRLYVSVARKQPLNAPKISSLRSESS